MIENVSVAICTYCGEHYLAEQLRSIINQERPVQEIVLCDDGSSDNTTEIAASVLASSGISYRIIKNKSNHGVTKNFEQCIAACTGEIILTSDQDDIWSPKKVGELIEAFMDPRVVLAYCDANIVDSNGKELHPSLYRRDGFWLVPFSQIAFEDAIVRLSQTVYGCTMAFRRDFVRTILPFFKSKANHDAWIMCCAPLYGKVVFVPEALMSYRIHGRNTVASIGGSKAWDDICAAQDEYDSRFAIQPLRELRLDVLEEACRRSSYSKQNIGYIRGIKSARRMYSRLITAKSQGKLSAAGKLFASLVDGSYRFRFCDRGISIKGDRKIKQFVCDMQFLLHRKR